MRAKKIHPKITNFVLCVAISVLILYLLIKLTPLVATFSLVGSFSDNSDLLKCPSVK